MGVPAGRGDARAVAAAVRQSRVGPGNPGGLDLDALEARQQRGIVLGRARRGERRCVPGAADHSDALEPLLFGGADGAAHVRLALRLFFVARGSAVPERGLPLQHALEDAFALPPLLDLLLPPELVIAVAGGL